MSMVRGQSDILFQALNARRKVRKKLGRVDLGGGGALILDTEWEQQFLHTSLTHICVFTDTAFLSCLTVTFFIKVIRIIEF